VNAFECIVHLVHHSGHIKLYWIERKLEYAYYLQLFSILLPGNRVYKFKTKIFNIINLNNRTTNYSHQKAAFHFDKCISI